MDPGCRKCMVWEEDKQNRELLQRNQRTYCLKETRTLLANEGQFEFLYTINNEHLVAYRMFNEKTLSCLY